MSANWKLGGDRPRAHSRAIIIGFSEHTDEPEANILYSEMQKNRELASASIGVIVRLGQDFLTDEMREHITSSVTPAVSKILSLHTVQARCTTTFAVFMYFFVEVCTCMHGTLSDW